MVRFGWVFWHYRLFNAKSSLYIYIKYMIWFGFMDYQSFVYTHLIDQTVLFQAIQFSISHLFALSLNVKQKGMNPIILPPAMGK